MAWPRGQDPTTCRLALGNIPPRHPSPARASRFEYLK